MSETKYDLIGDIHGHAEALIELLDHLGYQLTETGYCHPERKVIFLGDFIDRGEHLVQHRKLLDTVMPMVDNGHALAVMGNHEFNALAFHYMHKGEPLRGHSDKNINQHQAFLNEYPLDAEHTLEALAFFYRLPMWLELDGLRVVHACWSNQHIETIKDLGLSGPMGAEYLSEALLVAASTKGHVAFDAIETLLKGVEVELPSNVQFLDKDNYPRSAVRVQWWKIDGDTRANLTLKDVALPVGVDIQQAAHLPIPEGIPEYSQAEPPCFIGHYWWQGVPSPLSSNVACLDYSVVKCGKLVAYRWDGEQVLSADKFTCVES